jgi:hypothetical protein
MRIKKIWPGMLVMALTFGMTVVGCNKDDPLNGTWSGDNNSELTLTNGNFEVSFSGVAMVRGKSTSGSTITLTPAQYNGALFSLNDGWYDKSQLEAALKAADAWNDASSPGELNAMFSGQEGSFHDKTIIFSGMIFQGGMAVMYTKK